MKYSGASQVTWGGMAALLLTAPGCSSMNWFHSGSDEAAVSGDDRWESVSSRRKRVIARAIPLSQPTKPSV